MSDILCTISGATQAISTTLATVKQGLQKDTTELKNQAFNLNESNRQLDDKYERLIEDFNGKRRLLFNSAEQINSKCKAYDKLMTNNGTTKEQLKELVEGIKTDSHGLGELLRSTGSLMNKTIEEIVLTTNEYRNHKERVNELIQKGFNIKVEAERAAKDALEAAEGSSSGEGLGIAETVFGTISQILGGDCEGSSHGSIEGLEEYYQEMEELDIIAHKLQQVQSANKDFQLKLNVTMKKLRKESEIVEEWSGTAAAVSGYTEDFDSLIEDGDSRKSLLKIRIKLNRVFSIRMCNLRESAENWGLRKNVTFFTSAEQNQNFINCNYDKSNRLSQCMCS